MFEKKKIRLPNGVRVKVSRHFFYDFFGVRGRYETLTRTGTYINSLQPGTGFFVHGMDSRSYRHFVRDEKEKTEQSLCTLLFRREPNFAREIKRTEHVLDTQQLDSIHKQILVQYLNVLRLAQDEELDQRIVRGLKNKMHRRRSERSNYYTSILSNYKSRIAKLQHDVRGSQLDLKQLVPEEVLSAWGKVVEAFLELVEVRRLWHVADGGYEQVFFDLGIFNYIHSPFDTPVIRDSQGGVYFLYPQGVVRYRTNLDFDFIPLKDISFTGGGVDLDMVASTAEKPGRKGRANRSDALGQLYATVKHGVNAVGMLECSALGLTFYCNHVTPARHFAEVFAEFKSLVKDMDFSTLMWGGVDSGEKIRYKPHL